MELIGLLICRNGNCEREFMYVVWFEYVNMKDVGYVVFGEIERVYLELVLEYLWLKVN